MLVYRIQESRPPYSAKRLDSPVNLEVELHILGKIVVVTLFLFNVGNKRRCIVLYCWVCRRNNTHILRAIDIADSSPA